MKESNIDEVRSRIMKASRSSHMLFPCMIAIMFFMVVFLLMYEEHIISVIVGPTDHKPRLRDHKSEVDKLLSYPDAIVVISGGDSETTLIDGFLESISTLNVAPIYILTDMPECVDISKYDDTQYPLKIQQITIPDKYTAMDIKQYKASLFEYLPSYVKTVLYLDRDVRFTESFGDWVPPMFGDGNVPEACNIIMAPESTGKQSNEYHKYDSISVNGMAANSGILILNRVVSSECIQDWGKEMKSGKYSMDREALEATGHCHSCTIPGNSIHYINKAVNYFSWQSPREPMLHYTSSTHKKTYDIERECAKAKADRLFGFLDASCLHSITGGYVGQYLVYEDKECKSDDRLDDVMQSQ